MNEMCVFDLGTYFLKKEKKKVKNLGLIAFCNNQYTVVG